MLSSALKSLLQCWASFFPYTIASSIKQTTPSGCEDFHSLTYNGKTQVQINYHNANLFVQNQPNQLTNAINNLQARSNLSCQNRELVSKLENTLLSANSESKSPRQGRG